MKAGHISARLSLVQNLECFAHPGFVRYISVGRLLVFRSLAIPFPNKVRLGNALDRFQSQLFTPFLEIHKIDICGEVLATRAQVNPHALDPLMTKVSAQCSARLSMVDFGWRTAVVDCQKCATLKMVILLGPPGSVVVVRWPAE